MCQNIINSFLDLKLVVRYTANMSFHTAKLQFFYKILIIVVIVVVSIAAVLQYLDHKEKIESRIQLTYEEYRSVIYRIAASAFDPYTTFLKLTYKPLSFQDEDEWRLYIRKFLDSYSLSKEFSYISSIGYGNSPDFKDFVEYDRLTDQWQSDGSIASQLERVLAAAQKENQKPNTLFFQHDSDDMLYTFFQRVNPDIPLYLTLTLDTVLLYDTVIIPGIRELFREFEIQVTAKEDLPEKQQKSLETLPDFSYTFSASNLFKLRTDRFEWLIPLPKKVAGSRGIVKYEKSTFPKEQVQAALTASRLIASEKDIYSFISIQEEGQSVFAGLEQELIINWLMGLLLLLSIGAAFILLLLQLIKIQQQRDREKEFVASITHELKTPLTIIQSASDNLIRGAVPEKKLIRYGEHLGEQTKRLTNMVEEILMFSQLENRPKKNAILTLVNPQKLTVDICTNLNTLQDGNPISMKVSSLPQAAMLDSESLALIIRNLLMNALIHAYTNEKSGDVRFSAWLKIPNKLVFSVEDDGAGIAGSEQRKIFQPFYRTKVSRDQQKSGSGLGLFLASKKAKMMQSSLTINSPYIRKSGEKSAGCRFILQVPYIAPSQETDSKDL
jgi:signal transduction histidine kinase